MSIEQCQFSRRARKEIGVLTKLLEKFAYFELARGARGKAVVTRPLPPPLPALHAPGHLTLPANSKLSHGTNMEPNEFKH